MVPGSNLLLFFCPIPDSKLKKKWSKLDVRKQLTRKKRFQSLRFPRQPNWPAKLPLAPLFNQNKLEVRYFLIVEAEHLACPGIVRKKAEVFIEWAINIFNLYRT